MFDVSDQELDGLEAQASQSDRGARAYQPIGDIPIGPSGEPPPVVVQPPPTPMRAPTQSFAAPATGAGKALVLVTMGMVSGGLVGGPWGAGAGIALMGAVRNVLRVKECWGSPNDADRSEAGKSATMAFFGLGLAAVLGYQAYKAREA